MLGCIPTVSTLFHLNRSAEVCHPHRSIASIQSIEKYSSSCILMPNGPIAKQTGCGTQLTKDSSRSHENRWLLYERKTHVNCLKLCYFESFFHVSSYCSRFMLSGEFNAMFPNAHSKGRMPKIGIIHVGGILRS